MSVVMNDNAFVAWRPEAFFRVWDVLFLLNCAAAYSRQGHQSSKCHGFGFVEMKLHVAYFAFTRPVWSPRSGYAGEEALVIWCVSPTGDGRCS